MARINGPESAAEPGPPGGSVGRRNQNLQAVPEIAADDQPQEDNGAAEAQEQPEQEEPQPEQAQQPAPNGSVVKTPEQLLRELQQQQQQQQQPQNGDQGTPPQ